MIHVKKEARILVFRKCLYGYVFIVFRGDSIEDIDLFPGIVDDYVSLMNHVRHMRTFYEIRYVVSPIVSDCIPYSNLGIYCLSGSQALENLVEIENALDKLCRLVDKLYFSMQYGVYYGGVTLI